ncbi:MAG: hypothetical protein ACRD2A_22300 [Vicinamibacterales bacterium]
MSDMITERRDEIIEVLDCDLGARPKTAPGIDALLPHVRAATRTSGAVLVEFDDKAAPTLQAFVEAERLCCAGISWEIERTAGLRLRISATDAQLSAIESLWKANIESSR